MPPTIRDLQTRSCFVCLATDTFENRGPSSSFARQPRTHAGQTAQAELENMYKDDWVHPCSCTLVAHHSCLIKMIDMAKTKKPQCPQCKDEYNIATDPSLSLSLFRLFNHTMNIAGKIIVGAGAAAMCMFTADRFFCIVRLYGTYTIKSIFGRTLFDILLTDDPGNWSLSNRIFIPVLSLRVLLSSQPFHMRHLLSYVLCFPSEPPSPIRNELVRTALHAGSLTRIFSTPFDTFTPRWPPTRIQFAASIYMGHLLYDVIMLRTVRLKSLLPGNTSLLFDAWSLSVLARAWRRRRGPRVGVQQRDGDAPQGDVAPLDPQVAAPEAVLTTQRSPLVQVLLLPLIANGMGELLKRAAGHWHPAQHFLGIRPQMGITNIGITLSADMLTDVNYWKRFTVWLWTEGIDPVWIRNTIGLGLFVMAKDCLHTLHLLLHKIEIQSRTVKSRNFAGLDPRELDLIRPAM